MGGRFNYLNTATPPRFEHLDDGGRVVWRSDAAPAYLLPDSYALSWSGSVAFPEPVKGNGMFYSRTANPPFLDIYNGAIFDIARPGEWGPDKSGGYLLSSTLIGTVPAGCNHLEVDVVLTHTTPAVDDWWGFPITDLQKPGKHILPDTGFLPLEARAPLRRTMTVWLADADNGDGDVDGIGATRNVYIERRQSIAAITSFTSVTSGTLKTGTQSYDGSPTGAWEGKFTHDGDPGGWPLLVTGTVTSGDLHMMRGGSNAPVSGYTTTYASTWDADIAVRPGYVHT